MSMKKSTRYLVQGAVIAALYASLTILQNTLLPGSASAAVQFRVSEILCVLALFTPAAIPGLAVGCAAANLSSVALLGPCDLIFGSLASLAAAVLIYFLRNVKVRNFPLLPFFVPAVVNGLIIGWEIEVFFIDGPFNPVSFLIQGGLVALGELAVMLVLGIPFYFALNKAEVKKVLFK